MVEYGYYRRGNNFLCGLGYSYAGAGSQGVNSVFLRRR